MPKVAATACSTSRITWSPRAITSSDSYSRFCTSMTISSWSTVSSGKVYSDAPKYEAILETFSRSTSPAKKIMKNDLATFSGAAALLVASESRKSPSSAIDSKTALPRVARKMTRSSDGSSSCLTTPETCPSIDDVPAPHSESDMSSVSIVAMELSPACVLYSVLPFSSTICGAGRDGGECERGRRGGKRGGAEGRGRAARGGGRPGGASLQR